MTDTPHAISARRDQIASEPRPSPFHPMERHPGPSLWRVYRPEWTVVHTETCCGATACDDVIAHQQAALAKVDDRAAAFTGRVKPEDLTVNATLRNGAMTYQLMLRAPVCKGEFKTAILAHRWAEERGFDEWWVAARDSREDHQLRGYGTKLLKDPL